MPHRHLLIGGAGHLDLAAHELAEGTCGGRASESAGFPASEQALTGLVFSLADSDQQTPAPPVAVVLFALMPLGLLLPLFNQYPFLWWQVQSLVRTPGLMLPPKTPPPRSIFLTCN